MIIETEKIKPTKTRTIDRLVKTVISPISLEKVKKFLRIIEVVYFHKSRFVSTVRHD